MRRILCLLMLLSCVCLGSSCGLATGLFVAFLADPVDGAWFLETELSGRADCLFIEDSLVTNELTNCVLPTQLLQAFPASMDDDGVVTIPWSAREITRDGTTERLITLRGEFLNDSVINGFGTLTGTIGGESTSLTFAFTMTRR
ncbi:MAG: hypothetical protein MI923_02470 [Phycisphaerales bacterium]|nr:hypothetical protein [Phycisphaerales bacterium]